MVQREGLSFFWALWKSGFLDNNGTKDGSTRARRLTQLLDAKPLVNTRQGLRRAWGHSSLLCWKNGSSGRRQHGVFPQGWANYGLADTGIFGREVAHPTGGGWCPSRERVHPTHIPGLLPFHWNQPSWASLVTGKGVTAFQVLLWDDRSPGSENLRTGSCVKLFSWYQVTGSVLVNKKTMYIIVHRIRGLDRHLFALPETRGAYSLDIL